MNRTFASIALAAAALTPMVASAPAFAQDHGYGDHRYDDRGYDHGDRGYDHGDREYHGHDGRYRHRCGGGNGAVGTIAGGAGGALLGNAVGGGTLGTVAGGVGGALLGRHLDKSHTRSREGC